MSRWRIVDEFTVTYFLRHCLTGNEGSRPRHPNFADTKPWRDIRLWHQRDETRDTVTFAVESWLNKHEESRSSRVWRDDVATHWHERITTNFVFEGMLSLGVWASLGADLDEKWVTIRMQFYKWTTISCVITSGCFIKYTKFLCNFLF